MIYAKKGTLLRTYPEQQWKLMGANKNGWEQITQSGYNSLIGQKKVPTPQKVTIPGFPKNPVAVATDKFTAIDLTVKKGEEERLAKEKLGKDRIASLEALGATPHQITELKKLVNVGELTQVEFDEVYNQAKQTIDEEKGQGEPIADKKEKAEDLKEKTEDKKEDTKAPVIPSTQYTQKVAKEMIGDLKTVEEVLLFIKGDERKVVKDFAAKKVSEING